VEWFGAPSAQDTLFVVRHIEARHAELRVPIVYLGILGPTATGVSSEVRALFAANLTVLVRCCESIQIVLEGKGFAHAVQRGVMAEIGLASGYGDAMRIATSLKEAVERAAPSLRQEMRTAVREALATGGLASSPMRDVADFV
jgi:hypothetical protein